MLILYDPGTLLLIAGGAQAAGQLAQGEQKAQQQEARADLARQQAGQEEVATQREQRDLRQQRRRTLAQTRAALAGQGASLSGTQALGIQSRQAEQFAQRETRLLQDSRIRQRTLRARADNLDDSAEGTRVRAFVSAVGSAASAGAKSDSFGDGSSGGGSRPPIPGRKPTNAGTDISG